MIAYFDTSALIKLYVSELHRDRVLALRDTSDVLATVLITYTEVQSAFARRMREDKDGADALRLDRLSFIDDWPHWLVTPIDQSLVELAGRYAEAFALRAYDSIHLASAQTLRQRVGIDVTFACFDRRLNNAADLLGLKTPFLEA
ncbi:MAG: type II toxin-antitoxin system VapC family toxin [Thauera sp.]|nr:type II toxin-antitoxin system VapC family toxin [Thauera sp.]